MNKALLLDAAFCNLRMAQGLGINHAVTRWAREIQRLTGHVVDERRSEDCRKAAEISNNRRRAHGLRNQQACFDALDTAKTTEEVAALVGITRNNVGKHMRALEGDGRVVRKGSVQRAIWERVE